MKNVAVQVDVYDRTSRTTTPSHKRHTILSDGNSCISIGQLICLDRALLCTIMKKGVACGIPWAPCVVGN